MSSGQEWKVKIGSHQMVHIGNNTHLRAAPWIKKLILGFVARCLPQVPELLVRAPTTNQGSGLASWNRSYHTQLTFSSYRKETRHFIVRRLSLLRANVGVLFDFRSIEKNSWAHAMLLELLLLLLNFVLTILLIYQKSSFISLPPQLLLHLALTSLGTRKSM